MRLNESLDADHSNLPELPRYPELMWLNRHHYAVPAALGVLVESMVPA